MEMTPASNIDVKRRNRMNTLRCILTCDRISQMELTQRLALSWPTVLQNVKELVAMGLIQEVGLYESTGGRKARAYAPVRDAKLAIGLDLTQNQVSVVLADLAGQVVQYKRSPCQFSLDDTYMEGLGTLVRSFVEENNAEDRILGVGISLPGIVTKEEDYLRHSHILGVWDVPTSTFSQYLPYPCRFINDANAAGLAEVYKTSAAEEMIYLSLSNSVGGAIINNGSLYTGKHHRAGEFGHNTLIPGGRRCYCGKVGCLDAYCSAKVLSNHTGGDLSAFFDGLRSKNAQIRRAWEEYLEYLAIAINNLNMTFDCDVIVGGYVGAFLEEFGGDLKTLLKERNTFRQDISYLKVCHYKLEAAAVGAALIWIDEFVQGL